MADRPDADRVPDCAGVRPAEPSRPRTSDAPTHRDGTAGRNPGDRRTARGGGTCDVTGRGRARRSPPIRCTNPPASREGVPCPMSSFPSIRPRSSRIRRSSGTTGGTPTSRPRSTVKTGRLLPGALPGVVRRRDRQRRLRRRHPQRAADDRARAQRSVRRRGRQARRPADRRHPRRRSHPAGGRRAAGRSGLGLHRHLRHHRTAAASSPSSSPMHTRRSGTSPDRSRRRGTSRTFRSPGSSTPA